MSKHVARRISYSPGQTKLVCLACDEVIVQNVVGGGNPSDIIACGECKATVEERAEALDEVANILIVDNAYPVGIYPPPQGY